MSKARFIKNLEHADRNVEQRLWAVQGHGHVVTSRSQMPSLLQPEVYAFSSTKDGKITNYTELHGSEQGSNVTHERVISAFAESITPAMVDEKTFLEGHAAAMVCHRQEFSERSTSRPEHEDAFNALADYADELAARVAELEAPRPNEHGPYSPLGGIAAR